MKENTTDIDPEHYRAFSSFQIEAAQKVLDKIALNGEETILDVGCGEGRITAALSKKIPKGKIIGIDPSAAMIACATSSFSHQEFPNLQFTKASAEEITTTEKADIVLIFSAFQWVRQPKKALKNIYRALKPGGSLFILTYPKESPYWNLFKEIINDSRFVSYKPQSAYDTVLTTSGYKKIIEEAGFIVNDCALEENVVIYKTPQELSDYVKGWIHCFAPFPPPLETLYLNEMCRRASLEYQDPNSKEIRMPYLKLVIEAKKSCVSPL